MVPKGNILYGQFKPKQRYDYERLPGGIKLAQTWDDEQLHSALIVAKVQSCAYQMYLSSDHLKKIKRLTSLGDAVETVAKDLAAHNMGIYEFLVGVVKDRD